MRLTGSRAYIRPTPVPKMPPGLVELMEDVTRDVLKNNPPDVYEFCAEHMRKLLEIRDGPSLKQPLTLEQKIARAQEKIRKRGDARWQKYLKEKEISKTKTTLEDEKNINNEINEKQSSPTVQPLLKPPVYPNLYPENASEIEISHQAGNVSDLSVKIVQEMNTNSKMDDKANTSENNYLTEKIEKTVYLVTSSSTDDDINSAIDNTKDDHNTNVNSLKEVISSSNKNEGIDEVTVVKKQVEENQMPTNGTNCEVKDNNNALSDDPKNCNESEENQILTTEANFETKENNEPLLDPPKNSDELKNNQIPNLEAKFNTKENNEPPSHEGKSDPPKNADESKKENVVVEGDSEMVETAPIQGISPDIKNYTENLELETERYVKNSITDMEKLVNTAVGVHNVLSERSHSPSIVANSTNDENDHETIVQDEKDSAPELGKAELATETSSPVDNESLKNIIIKESDDDKIKKFPETEINEYSIIENVNDNNISDDTQQHIASEKSTIYTQKSQDDKSITENSKEQPNIIVLPVEEDSDENLGTLEITELGDSQKMLDENVSSIGSHNFEPPIIHVDDSSDIDKSENIHIHESSKESLNSKSTDALAAPNSIQGHGEESLTLLDIHETKQTTQEPNDGNIIEIRISQAAEALNNEVPLIIEDDQKLSEEEVGLVPLTENKVNTQFINEVQNDDTGEENEGHILQKSETVDDTPSTNTDDAHNVKTSDTIRSISIDKITDGLDNTSLIESGTSEATDDVIQHSPNTNSMDLETAAVTIQKVFRSFLFKSRTSTFDDNEDNISLDEDNEKKDQLDFQVCNANVNKERRGISRMDTVLQTVNEEKSLSLSTDDSSTLSSAATTIQAHVRGFLLRNKLHSHKTTSSSSLVNSDGRSASLDGDVDHKNKTILNIHIVPEGGNYLSRDESMLTSMELSLDGSPPSSLNLHPLGYDKNERRKQLKREDAIQSISPPSNNSGKLSEDVESVKDMLIAEGELQTDERVIKDDAAKVEIIHNRLGSGDTSPTNSLTIETVIETHRVDHESSDLDPETPIKTKGILTKQSSDEMDVVTPFEDKNSLIDSRSTPKLLHSGEFHDIVLPTKVSRNDASVVSEFKNVLVYFLLWNNS